MPLHDVLNLKPGSRTLLNAMPTSTIDMRCGNVSLFSGKMGRKSGNIAVRISNRLRKMRSEEHTSELQSLMRISYAVFCLKKKTQKHTTIQTDNRGTELTNNE